jgi:hypothetical protein
MKIQHGTNMANMNMWTIYNRPLDYPKNIVVRRFEMCKGKVLITNDIQICNSLDEARSKIPYECVCFPRDITDEPPIVETWL